MKQVLYVCDRCGDSAGVIGKEQGQIELWNLRLVAEPVVINGDGGVKAISAHLKGFMVVQWCAHCVAEIGASSATDEARAKILQVEEAALKTPSFETVLVDLLADHIADVVHDAVNDH